MTNCGLLRSKLWFIPWFIEIKLWHFTMEWTYEYDNPLDPTWSEKFFRDHVLHHQLPRISRTCTRPHDGHNHHWLQLYIYIYIIVNIIIYIYIFGPSQPKKNINFPRVSPWKLTTPSFPSFRTIHPDLRSVKDLHVPCRFGALMRTRHPIGEGRDALLHHFPPGGIALKSWSHCG